MQINYFMSFIRTSSKSNYFLFSITENLIRLEKINKQSSRRCFGKSIYLNNNKKENLKENLYKIKIEECDLMLVCILIRKCVQKVYGPEK